MLVDYHVHVQSHGEYGFSQNRLRDFAAAAARQGVSVLGLADHDWLVDGIDCAAVAAVRRDCPGLEISQGLEVDFLPGCEPKLRQLLQTHAFDYLLGSVHSVDGFAFDVPSNRRIYGLWAPDALYRRYYQLLLLAVQSGLFDVLAHLDVIKVFGCRAQADQSAAIMPVLAAIRQAGLVVEINSNGWHKPVGEQYPDGWILQACWQAGIPITLSSDAHEPEQVGRDICRARALAWQIGYRQVAIFRQRQRLLLPL